MWLILGNDNDFSALWLTQRLQRRGLHDVQLISSSAVAFNLYWNHRMAIDCPDAEFVLSHGQRFRTDGIGGVFNRLTSVPRDVSRAVLPAARRYAEQEEMAYFVSWLYGLTVPVINRPAAHNPTGAWRRPSEWTMLAAVAGLAAAPFCQSEVTNDPSGLSHRLVPFEMPVQTIYVVGDQVVGAALPKDVAARCVKMARLANTEVLGIDFTVSGGAWLVAGVNANPDLRPGGEPLIDAVIGLMERLSPARCAVLAAG